MERFYQLYFTPSYSLSVLIESESNSPTFLRYASQFLLFSRSFFKRSSPLFEALENELTLRPTAEANGLISSSTLRIVDNAYHLSRKDNFFSEDSRISAEDLAILLSSERCYDNDLIQQLLSKAIERIFLTYNLRDMVIIQSNRAFAADDGDNDKLVELFTLLRPKSKLTSLISKQWQELGFQGTSPTTDFRSLNTLALDSLLYFAKEFPRSPEILEEAVEGEAWYPFALASIHITAFALDMLVSRDLQLLLLRYYQVPTDPFPLLNSNSESTSNLAPFLRISCDLLVLFHEYWLRNKYTVMQFETVSKEFQAALKPWIRRGVLDGRALGWSNQRSIEDKKTL